jgi:hypothetical protein
LFGVLLAGVIVGSNKATPLAVAGDNFQSAALVLGVIGFVVVIVGMYMAISRIGRRVSEVSTVVQN